MGSHRKKKGVSSGNSSKPPLMIDEAAASSTSSASTDAARYSSPHFTRPSNNLKHMQPVESGGSDCSTAEHANKRSARTNRGGHNSSTADWSTDFATALHEVDLGNNTFRFSWKEIVALCLILAVFASISIFVGVAAGISISVHYYETPENMDVRLLNSPIMDSVAHRVTILDPAIASSNRLHPLNRDDELRRVIHTSPTGQKSLVQIVEESSISLDDPNLTGTKSEETTTPYFPQRPRYPSMVLDEWIRDKPKLCSNRKTTGYDTWKSLRSAVRDVNRYSANRFDRWHDYFAMLDKMKASPNLYPGASALNPASFADDRMYYEEKIVLTICPGAVLRATRQHPVFINTESLVLECDHCKITGGMTHLFFGPEAKNVMVRGISFGRAQSNSLVFHHDGAEVSFEDCKWLVRGVVGSNLGAIAEVNSTSRIFFYRCEVNTPNGKPTEMTTALRNV